MLTSSNLHHASNTQGRLTTALLFSVLYLNLIVMSIVNDILTDCARRTGGTVSGERAECSTRPVTLEYAKSQGFDTVEEYLEALHEFLNSN